MRRIRFASLLIAALLLAAFFAAGPVRAGVLPGAAGAPWTLGGAPCNLIAVQAAAPPVGVLEACDGVRPGAVVQSDVGGCTFNFLFTGNDGRRYIGTAGHCILPADGEQSWAPGAGPEARDGNDQRIGEFAYAVLQDPKDFSLIRLDPGVAASPQMCHFGGPTGINEDQPSTPTVLNHFGQGLGLGATVPARTAVATSMPDPDHVYADGAIIFGDSGSGIISDDGRAVGVIVTVGLHAASIGTSGVDAGSMGITRLAPQVARAEQVLGIGLTLQTAPLL